MRKSLLVAWTALAMTGLLLGIILYWSVLPLKPIIEIKNMTAETNNKSLVLSYDYCKNADNKGLVTRFFKDEILYYMSNIYSNAPAGCNHANQIIDLPENLPPDVYSFNFEITYKVSPIKEKTYRFETNKFEVR